MKIKFDFIKFWLLLLCLSFSYELPVLQLSTVDRFNPRLFDIVVLLAIFILYIKKFRIKNDNKIFNIWVVLLLWFLFCILITALVSGFPSSINYYMYYYIFEYIKGLIVCMCLMAIPIRYLEPEGLAKYLVLGGVVTSIYCLYELNFPTDVMVLSDGLSIVKPENYIWGPFVGSYFQLSMYLPFVFILSVALFDKYRKIRYITLAVLFAWPTLYTGSRTHLFMMLAVITIYCFFRIKSIYSRLFVLVAGVLISLILYFYGMGLDVEGFETLSRMESLEGNNQNSIINRVLLFVNFNISSYDNDLLLPFIGGGFYVAPVDGSYRIGFGFHNIYLFALEQAGFIGLCIFLIFLVAFLRPIPNFIYNCKDDPQYLIVIAFITYVLAMILLGFSAHTFWRGFTTSNLNTLRLIVLMVSYYYITKVRFYGRPFG